MCTLTTSPGVSGGSAAGYGVCALASSAAFSGAAPAKLWPLTVLSSSRRSCPCPPSCRRSQRRPTACRPFSTRDPTRRAMPRTTAPPPRALRALEVEPSSPAPSALSISTGRIDGAGGGGHPGFYAARVRGNTDGGETSRNSCCSGSMRGSTFGEVDPTRAEVVCTPPSANHGGPHEYERRDRHRHPSFPRRDPGGAARRVAPAHHRDPLAQQGARRRPLAGCAVGGASGARALLGVGARLAQDRGEAERAAAVHDRDRRRGDPLHPRQVRARERAAADHDARLARLRCRAARLRRPADRPDRARRQRRGRLPSRAALSARVRALRRAGRGGLGPRPDGAGLGRADAPTRLHPLRGPGRRRGRRCHRHDGSPGTRGAGRHPHEPARAGAGRPDADRYRRGTRRGRAARHVREVRQRLLRRDGHPPADDRLRPPSTLPSRWPPG